MKKLKTLNVYWVVALLITVAIAGPWININYTHATFIKEYTGVLGIGFLMIITLWKTYSNNAQVSFKLSWLKIGWLLLFLLGTLSIFYSVYTDFSIDKWMLWFAILSAFIVGYRLKLDKATLIKLCWGLLISALTIAIIGIMQYLFEFSGMPQAISPASTFGNKNMATQPIVLMLPFTLFLLFSEEVKGFKIWLVTFSISLIMLYIFYTHTRASWLSIGIEITLLAGFLILKRKTLSQWISWDKTKTLASIFAFLLFIVLINFNAQGLDLFSHTVTNVIGSAENSAESRFKIWVVAIDMIKTSPIFGTGLGSWFYQSDIIGAYGISTADKAHNDLLQLGVELGLTGLLLFVGSVIMTLIGLFNIVKLDNKIHAWFYYLMWAAIGGSFVQMQLSFPYQLIMPSLLFGLYLGMIAQRSEKFIEPIKIIPIQAANTYQTAMKSLVVTVMAVIVVIYANWIVMYAQLSDTSEITEIGSIISQSHFIPLINKRVSVRLGNQKTKEALLLNQYLLDDFPNYNHAISNHALGLAVNKRYDEALSVLERLERIATPGYRQLTLRMKAEIYINAGKKEKFQQTFDQIVKYSYVQVPRLGQWTLDIYKYYQKYNCTVENKMASILVKQGKIQQARQHIAIINKNKSTCLAAELRQYQQ